MKVLKKDDDLAVSYLKRWSINSGSRKAMN